MLRRGDTRLWLGLLAGVGLLSLGLSAFVGWTFLYGSWTYSFALISGNGHEGADYSSALRDSKVLEADIPNALAHLSPAKAQIMRLLPLARRVSVNESSVQECIGIMSKALSQWDPSQLKDLTLVIYHLGSENMNYSKAVQLDNIRVFTSSVNQSHPAFYLFQVFKGRHANNFAHLLPKNLGDHSCVVDYANTPYDVTAHFTTLALLPNDILVYFKQIFMLNHSARGPLTHRDGEWLQIFSKMISLPNIILAGPRIGCAFSPHVQTHAFVMRSSMLPLLLPWQMALGETEIAVGRPWTYIQHAEVGMSLYVQLAGFEFSSREIVREFGTARFISSYCDPSHKLSQTILLGAEFFKSDLIFYKFGGTGAMRSCDRELVFDNHTTEREGLKHHLMPKIVGQLTAKLKRREPDIGLIGATSFCREGSSWNGSLIIG